MEPTAIFSKTGKGVQEASGKTSHLSRADRNVLKEIDGKTSLADIAVKFEKISADKFDALITQLDKDGFIREVASASQNAAPARPTPPPPSRSAPPPKAPPAGDADEALDFTQAIKVTSRPTPTAPSAPKPPPMDLAAASRADAERKAKEDQATDYKSRQEAEAKAKAEADARAKAEARARAEAEAKARAEAEAKARAEAEARARDADAKVKAAREAAIRMATDAKAKSEAAEERARKEAEDKARLEAELNAKLEAERKAREDAERRAAEAAERARKELEEKAKRDAEELRERLEAEMKAKLEAERKAREEEDRKRRKEEDERRAKEEAERRAKEAAERKAREEEDRKRREEDERRRKEEDERRAKEAAERKREEEDRKRRREEDDRRAREESERRAKDEADARARSAASSASVPTIEPAAPPPASAAAGGIGDALLADLESFGKQEEEERQAKEEADRKAKAEAARRAKEETERRAKEEADKKRRDEEARRRKEEDERRAKEEAEREAREEEERKANEEAERKRKAKEALAAKQAAERAERAERAAKSAARSGAAAGATNGGEDIEVSDEDLDMDDVKRDQKVMAKATARKAAVEPVVAVPGTGGGARPKKWGKPVAIGLFVVLVGGVGLLNVMPVATGEYEKAASEALGVPVKIGSARMSALAGIEMKFENVSVGDAAKIRLVRASPEIGTVFGGRKAFSRLDLEGVSASQSQIADALLGKAGSDNFRIGRIVIKQLNLEGPLKLPPVDVEALVSGDGSLQSVSLRGADNLNVKLSPKGGEIGFEISAGSFAVPIVPALSLAEFGMKGTANRGGVTSSEFDGRAYDGVISGTATIRWGASWTVEGEVKARNVKVAVFAPALVSEGKVEGRAAYTMAGSAPATLYESARMQGEFKIEKGVLGSFDLTRALQTGGAQSAGRTVFTELTGQGVYDKGAVQLRNIAVSAGAMNAGMSVDIDANGGLAGRIAADVKTPNQTLRATLNISGKVQDPVIRK